MSTEQNNAKRNKSKSKEKIKKSSSKNNLKRPMTPYFLFCSKKREEQAKSGDGKRLTAKELGAMWKKLTEEEKKPFTEKYEIELKKYNEMLVELNKKSEEEKNSKEEDGNIVNKKKGKAKAKTKKSQNDKNNKKACNCGECDECVMRKKRKEEEDEEIEDNKLAKRKAKKAVDDEGDD